MSSLRELKLDGIKRIVVKIGSSSLVHPETGGMDFVKIDRLARELCDIKNQGFDVCLVTSGAIAVGRTILGTKKQGETTAMHQACASVGQTNLMLTYQKAFADYHQTVGQILMTKLTISIDENRRNARNTFEELFKLGVIPIVNENDTVSTYEISLGDNDTLSSIVTSLIGADLLILLSDIDGLYTDDPHTNKEAKLIPVVEKLDEKYLSMARSTSGSEVGTGGMEAKMRAAKIATSSGAQMVIANGKDVAILHRIIANKFDGTIFMDNKDENFKVKEWIKEN